MSGSEGSGDKTQYEEKTETQTSDAGASSKAQAEESLEDQLHLLHRQIQNSDWLQNNTAEMWMDANPEAASELKKIIAEKQAAQNS